MRIGVYPTPVQRLDERLWVKRDDLTSPRYGGNKVRKLERVLERAVSLGVRRIVTIGAAGSHHVLATALYARDVGIDVDAVLVPQPRTGHVAENLCAIAAHARVLPATSFAHAATVVVDRVACGAHYVPPGGSTRFTTRAYADAAKELLLQVARDEMPLPSVVVVPVGSGGTAAGLAAGFARAGSTAPVHGVLVSAPRGWVVRRTRKLAAGCLADLAPSTTSLRLAIDERYLGDGYGHPTEPGRRAIVRAAESGLELEPTYTAKTFAAALDIAAAPPEREDGPVLFWNTVSSAPFAPLLGGAPSESDLPDDLRALLR